MANNPLAPNTGIKINRNVYLCAVGVAFVLVGLLTIISFKGMRWVGGVFLVLGGAMIFPLYRQCKKSRSNKVQGQG